MCWSLHLTFNKLKHIKAYFNITKKFPTFFFLLKLALKSALISPQDDIYHEGQQTMKSSGEQTSSLILDLSFGVT